MKINHDHFMAEHILGSLLRPVPGNTPITISYRAKGYRDGSGVVFYVDNLPTPTWENWHENTNLQVILRRGEILVVHAAEYIVSDSPIDVMPVRDPLFIDTMISMIRGKRITCRQALIQILTVGVSVDGTMGVLDGGIK